MSKQEKYKVLALIAKEGLKIGNHSNIYLASSIRHDTEINGDFLLQDFLDKHIDILNALFAQYISEPLKQVKAEAEQEAKEFLGLDKPL